MYVTIPFYEVLYQILTYAKIVKDLLTKKRKFPSKKMVKSSKWRSEIIRRKLTLKQPDPWSFRKSCTIGKLNILGTLYDLGASISLVPVSMMKKLEVKARDTIMTLTLENKYFVVPHGILGDMFVKNWTFVHPVDYVIIDI